MAISEAPLATVWCPCGAEHQMLEAFAPTRPDQKRRVLCEACRSHGRFVSRATAIAEVITRIENDDTIGDLTFTPAAEFYGPARKREEKPMAERRKCLKCEKSAWGAEDYCRDHVEKRDNGVAPHAVPEPEESDTTPSSEVTVICSVCDKPFTRSASAVGGHRSHCSTCWGQKMSAGQKNSPKRTGPAERKAEAPGPTDTCQACGTVAYLVDSGIGRPQVCQRCSKRELVPVSPDIAPCDEWEAYPEVTLMTGPMSSEMSPENPAVTPTPTIPAPIVSTPLSDMVNRPPHYFAPNGLEVIDVIEAFELNFRLGSAIKYLLRAGRKGDRLEDLEKARFYVAREIEREKAARAPELAKYSPAEYNVSR